MALFYGNINRFGTFIMFCFNSKSQSSRLAIPFVVKTYKMPSPGSFYMRAVNPKAAKWIFLSSCCSFWNEWGFISFANGINTLCLHFRDVLKLPILVFNCLCLVGLTSEGKLTVAGLSTFRAEPFRKLRFLGSRLQHWSCFL